MPRTKFDVKPRVDWPVAVIIWAKTTQGLHWEDLADRVGMNAYTLRNLCVKKRSDEWQLYTLKKVLKELGYNYKDLLDMEDQ